MLLRFCLNHVNNLYKRATGMAFQPPVQGQQIEGCLWQGGLHFFYMLSGKCIQVEVQYRLHTWWYTTKTIEAQLYVANNLPPHQIRIPFIILNNPIMNLTKKITK